MKAETSSVDRAFARTELSFFKNFDFSRGSRIHFRVEAFNLLKIVRFGQPEGTIGTRDLRRHPTADDAR
jgi:hypothetical protein